jgi:hypothetical protein
MKANLIAFAALSAALMNASGASAAGTAAPAASHVAAPHLAAPAAPHIAAPATPHIAAPATAHPAAIAHATTPALQGGAAIPGTVTPTGCITPPNSAGAPSGVSGAGLGASSVNGTNTGKCNPSLPSENCSSSQ